jgi:phosphatidylserine decarboxylase
MWRKIKYSLLAFFVVIVLVGVFAPVDHTPIVYVDRSTGKLDTEKVAAEFWLRWLYGNPVGEMALEGLVKRKFVSEWYGKKMDEPESKQKIKPFIREFNINMSEVADTNFKCFNDFFIRKLKHSARPVDTALKSIISPGDGKILAYQNLDSSDFIIKGIRFNLKDFLQDSTLANAYYGGELYILRLAPYDYHRFHFPLSGEVLKTKDISGTYYSVSPIALREKVRLLFSNKRDYTVIHNDYAGDYIMAEVGATMVGSIVQTYKDKVVCKGQEKGYFKFGGSTIVLIFKKNKIKIDKDLLLNTKKGFETAVKMGEKIGTIL